jgi:hypothetical protein
MRRWLPDRSNARRTTLVPRPRSARRRLLVAFVLAVGVLLPIAPGGAQPALARSPEARFTFAGLGRTGHTTISGPVYGFGCGEGGGRTLHRSIYRWGCSEPGNRYLLGHAHASFKPLHDFMQAHGGSQAVKRLIGKIATWDPTRGPKVRYRVVWARVVGLAYFTRTFDHWASNATTRDSLTMQTCYGDASQYRIIVRLERIRS